MTKTTAETIIFLSKYSVEEYLKDANILELIDIKKSMSNELDVFENFEYIYYNIKEEIEEEEDEDDEINDYIFSRITGDFFDNIDKQILKTSSFFDGILLEELKNYCFLDELFAYEFYGDKMNAEYAKYHIYAYLQNILNHSFNYIYNMNDKDFKEYFKDSCNFMYSGIKNAKKEAQKA